MWETVYDLLTQNSIDTRSPAASAELCTEAYCVVSVHGYSDGYEQVAVTAYVPLENYSSLDGLCDDICDALEDEVFLYAVGGDKIESKIRAHSRTLYFIADEPRYEIYDSQDTITETDIKAAYIKVNSTEYAVDIKGKLSFVPVYKTVPADYVIIGGAIAAQTDMKNIFIGFDISLTNVICTDMLKRLFDLSGNDLLCGATKLCDLEIYIDDDEDVGLCFKNCIIDSSSLGYSGNIYGDIKLKCRPAPGQTALQFIDEV